MDGLSNAASGIAVVSIAIQLADSVKKLYDFWSSVKDAPESIRAIAKELELLSGILDKIEHGQHGTGSEISNVLESCREQVASLVTIVNSLVPGFEAESRRTRTWSSLKAVFKKDKVAEFRMCLAETKITLNLATK